MDWVMMGSFFLCLIAGFFIILPLSYGVGVFLLTVSFLSYVPVLFLPCYCQENLSFYSIINTASSDNLESEAVSSITRVHISHMRAKRYKLSLVLTSVLPLVPVVYLLAIFEVLDAPATIVPFLVLSVATKGLFAYVTMDIHFDLLVAARVAVSEENDRNANEARRAFLKYIFHELRNPLNSLTIGIEILGNSSHLDSHDLESLGMMKDASAFMNDTLNDVLSMQKIEEGKL